MAEMVTLRSPDGRLYRTDVASEINNLTARGYTVENNTVATAPNTTPPPEPEPSSPRRETPPEFDNPADEPEDDDA